MGQEIASDHFSVQDRQDYAVRLQQETALLRRQFEQGELSCAAPVAGFELEGWLVDADYRPSPCNTAFLQALNNPLATNELARFNIELNTDPLPLQGTVLSRFEQNLLNLLDQAYTAAAQVDARLLLIGILPSTVQEDFCLATMTPSNRYHALNAEILRARHGYPLRMDIDGRDSLRLKHDSLMLEAAATSFQIHMQLPAATAHHFYNAAIIASGPVMAVSGNSPFLFGHALWDETRIPLFEQAVNTGREQPARVSFGTGFAQDSLIECFEENQALYPVLLPMLQDSPLEQFAHLRLHNGVIWRWNRPLIGFDADGKTHVRLEHRILPAGPSVPDMIANAALFYGLTSYLGQQFCAGEPLPMAFAIARENFYNAALRGLEARHMRWHRQEWRVQELMLNELLPIAAEGLQQLGIDEADIRHYLSIIAARIETGQTGAVWQMRQYQANGGDLTGLLRSYDHHQRSHAPVHTWTLD
ncbi:MAG: glutamate--cysteine ligase [Thiolinea sp.]